VEHPHAVADDHRYNPAMVKTLTLAASVALFAIATLGDNPQSYLPPPASAPASASPGAAAAAPPSTQASGGPDTVLHEEYLFTDPPAGWMVYHQAGDESVEFSNEHLHSVILIAFEPKDMILDGMGGQMAKAIDGLPARSGGETVMHAKIEKDKRFDLKIHDKYKVHGKVGDQLHLYKNIGPRVVEVTIACSAEDQDIIDDVFKTGQDMLAAMKFDRKAFLKQKKIEDAQARQQRQH
jgi:hypothetical protein